MELQVHTVRRQSLSPDIIHSVKITDEAGKVIAKSIAWTTLPRVDSHDSGQTRLIDFKAKTAEHADKLHTAMVKSLGELKLSPQHSIVYIGDVGKKRGPHFRGFDKVREKDVFFSTLTTDLKTYQKEYNGLEPELPAQTAAPQLTMKRTPVKEDMDEESEEPNRVGLELKDTTARIQTAIKFAKTLAANVTSKQAQSIVLKHVLGTLPAHLGIYSTLISQANETVQNDGFEAMAKKLNRLMPHHAREIVGHVRNKTLEITQALELLRTHRAQFKVNEKIITADAAVFDAINDEAIRLHHVLTIGNVLSKHNK